MVVVGSLCLFVMLQIFDMVDAKARQDCIKEIDLLKQLNHPNVIKYLSSFVENNEVSVLEGREGGREGRDEYSVTRVPLHLHPPMHVLYHKYTSMHVLYHQYNNLVGLVMCQCILLHLDGMCADNLLTKIIL